MEALPAIPRPLLLCLIINRALDFEHSHDSFHVFIESSSGTSAGILFISQGVIHIPQLIFGSWRVAVDKSY
jgi:hypothetical protein